tara:strand:- start:196 stop:432 length:237 start_codon:yes stop_codon:yes gene_type:complete
MTDLTKCKTIEPLSPFQTRQKKFILQEYPMLDDLMVDTIVRMKGEKIDAIVEQIKSGELKHEEPMKPEDYIITSVKVE